MTLFVDKSYRVRYTGENGYDSDHNSLRAQGVKVGDILTVVDIDVGDWRSEMNFESLNGWHNSVMFEEVE